MSHESVLGAFARIFPVAPIETQAARFAALGLRSMQLNLSALGLATIPALGEIPAGLGDVVREALATAGVELWGVSATYNMADPDAARRRAATQRAAQFLGLLEPFAPGAVTVCTGTRATASMWQGHPDNASPAAWADMRASLDALLEAAVDAGVRVGIEPESGNVVSGTAAAVRLLRELGGDAAHVTIIVDPANLLMGRDFGEQPAILAEAFGELGDAIGCVHAKDLVGWDAVLRGDGVVDIPLVLRLSRELGRDVPVIIQDAHPDQVGRAIELLRAAER